MLFSLSKNIFCLVCLFLLVGAQKTSAQVEWKPVSPDEMQMTASKVEPDADAEAIFWEVRLDDKKRSQLAYNHYVRVKIFNDRGREKFSKIDIPFTKGTKVLDIAARVIKPDGTIVQLNPSDIFEREIARANKLKINAKSFAMPGIEPGVIVEYQYRQTFKNDSATGERLIFQRDVPMQKVTYYVRPYKGTNLSYSLFNLPDVKFVQDKDGFYVASMTNVPAFREEPQMPPEDQVRSWVFLFYAPFGGGHQTFGSLFNWGSFVSQYGRLHSAVVKPDKDISKTVSEITAGISSDEEKLEKIYEFVQTRIKNMNYDPAVTEEQVERMDLDNPVDVLKTRAGTAGFINFLFASMASAAGFETRMYFSGNRSELFFNPEKVPHSSFVHWAGTAVRIRGAWSFFDPGTPYLAFGDMFWHDEDTYAILVGEQNYTWIKTPLSTHNKTLIKRGGKFKLLEDGTLEGTVRMEYHGHSAISRREEGWRDSPERRAEFFKEQLKERISTAEISALTVENFEDSSKPVVYTYKIRVPNYAQKTGKRIFFQPGFFEFGRDPLFSSKTRKYDIFFPFPWSEDDEIEIELPKDYELENADAPADAGDPSKISGLKINMQVVRDANTLRYNRKFYFGGDGKILFPVSVYQPLKNLFDIFHKADTHSLSIRQKQ